MHGCGLCAVPGGHIQEHDERCRVHGVPRQQDLSRGSYSPSSNRCSLDSRDHRQQHDVCANDQQHQHDLRGGGGEEEEFIQNRPGAGRQEEEEEEFIDMNEIEGEGRRKGRHRIL